jgi:hypothetical protein
MSITVEEQVVQGDRVASRFVVTGTSYGRPVRFNGITISRFDNGLIVEDWSVTDTIGMLRQLGAWNGSHGNSPVAGPGCRIRREVTRDPRPRREEPHPLTERTRALP